MDMSHAPQQKPQSASGIKVNKYTVRDKRHAEMKRKISGGDNFMTT